MEITRKIEVELELVEKLIADSLKEFELLTEWKNELEKQLDKAVRREEFPETVDKKVDDSPSSPV